ncbi:PQQ-binding-like beta-propeller repeat protein [Phenylobacterium sp.]|uniref:outer membrane protein assembly factor BamB family protein n=1 Tax=Phenylobacterium sp. TaxID=1871053 RepID=UPI00286B01DB|nr:PQQ-binding-like beta-propeller repeat protein [Phenylobacterium sp.]
MPSARNWLSSLALAGLAAMAVLGSAQAQTPAAGAAIYEARCKACHEGGVQRAPDRAALAQRTPDDIVHAMTGGIMTPMAQGLSDVDKQAVATYLTMAGPQAQGRPAGIEMPRIAVKGPSTPDPRCAANPPIRATPGDWASMGLDARSSRFQRRPGLTAADLPRLKVKWSYAMTGGGQPTVVGDWLFVTNRSGRFYALDAQTGCVHWSVDDLVSRTTPMVIRSPISPSGWLTVVGQNDRLVRAFDAQTGKQLWRSAELETHPISVLTGSPVIAGDRLLVPISSIEEAAAMSKSYACCTFRGSLAALDLATGKLLWKTTMIPEPARVVREKDTGQKVTGPAGAAIWAAPSLDLKRGQVYVVTGDSYTDVDTIGPDAVLALDIRTGAIRWRRQVTERDNFVMGCGPASTSGNCPTPMGPDYDFGATPILMTLKGGKQVLVAGQKSGIVYGLNPDTGALVWKTQVGVGSALGGVEWGIGANDTHVFVPIADFGPLMAEMRPGSGRGPAARAGLYALNPATGAIVWSTPAPRAPCVYASDKGKPSRCVRSQSAAPAVIPGAVLEGGLDGWFRAYDAGTGKILWEDSTTSRTYDTVNGVKGQPGGGIDGMGPTVANGMVYVVSGNNGAARVGSNGVNVLLAYSVDGK